ncbi:MAG: EVE domain-containing protein [Desulfurococcaceae archaeon]
MVKHWIFVTSPENYKVCEKYGVFGVDERYRTTCSQHVSAGDMVFFYITSPKRVFIGPWVVKSPCKHNPNHVAVKEWKSPERRQVKYVYIIDIEKYGEIGECRLNKVIKDLLFITNKRLEPSGGYTDHFQFSIISIRVEDFCRLLNCVIAEAKSEQESTKSLLFLC